MFRRRKSGRSSCPRAPPESRQRGHRQAGRPHIRDPVCTMHLGLPHAGRDLPGAVEPVEEATSVRDVLLRPDELFPVPAQTDVEGPGP